MTEQVSQSNSAEAGDRNGQEYRDLLKSAPEDALRDPETRSPYSSSELARLNFESFRVSQGSPELHPLIIEYIVARFGDRVTLDALSESIPSTESSAGNFSSKESIHQGNLSSSANDMMKDLGRFWDQALEIGQPALAERLPEIRAKILKLSLGRDYKYLIVEGGRHRSGGVEDGRARPSSKYLSQVAYYGLAGHSTQVPEYDAMFADLAQDAEADGEQAMKVYSPEARAWVGRSVESVLRELVSLYVSHYPDEAERLPDKWLPEADSQAV